MHLRLTQALIPLMVMLSVIMGVMACTPGMDYWYSEEITLGNTKLPPHVKISATDPVLQPRALIYFEDDTNSVIYVMSLAYKDVLVMATPDPYLIERVKGAQEAASFLLLPRHTTHLDIPALIDLDKNLVDRNVLSSDPPPQNVSIPTAQSSELLLVYGSHVIEVPFTLAYSLNTHYGERLSVSTPARVQTASHATSSPQAPVRTEWKSKNGFVVAALVGIDLIAVSAWLIWKGMRRSR